MIRDPNWAFGSRVVGMNNKKVQLFTKMKAVVNCYDLKICVHEKFVADDI